MRQQAEQAFGRAERGRRRVQDDRHRGRAGRAARRTVTMQELPRRVAGVEDVVGQRELGQEQRGR